MKHNNFKYLIQVKIGGVRFRPCVIIRSSDLEGSLLLTSKDKSGGEIMFYLGHLFKAEIDAADKRNVVLYIVQIIVC